MKWEQVLAYGKNLKAETNVNVNAFLLYLFLETFLFQNFIMT